VGQRFLRWLPAVILIVGGAAAWALARGRPVPEARIPEAPPPWVEVLEVAPRDSRVRLRTHGSVEPRTEIDLVAEIAGRVISVSPALDTGGFFDAGEVLVELDSRDSEIAVERAEATLARRYSEARLAETKLERLQALAAREIASPAALAEVEYQRQISLALVREARAARDWARRDVERTTVRVPFAGRVRTRRVGVGQFVARGAVLARVYAVDYAEVRLPLPIAEVALLGLPTGAGAARGPVVRLRASSGDSRVAWAGRIVRSEGEIAQRSRMVNAVARVEDPYGLASQRGRPPLTVGLFVEAEILGRTLEDVVVLPRSAVTANGEVLVVDETDRLRTRNVEVVRVDGERVLVAAGLAPGERVCASVTPGLVGAKVRARPIAAADAARIAARGG